MLKVFWGLLIAAIILIISCTQEHDPKAIIPESAAAQTEDKKQNTLYETYKAALEETNDSIKNEKLLDLSYNASYQKNSPLFLSVNREARVLSATINDTAGVAETFWDLATYYYRHNKKDSSYYYYNEAKKLYDDLNDRLNSGRLLVNMGIIQKNIKDYTGSEVTSIQAIQLLKPFEDYVNLYNAYNNLGIIFNEMEEYENAIRYHDNALENLKKSGHLEKLPATYNNIGVVYNNKKDYSQAVEYFKKALAVSENLQETNPRVYAMILDNEAYARLHLEDTAGVYQQMREALKIRREIDHQAGISMSYLHLADYFLFKKDTANALQQALKAEKTASKNNNTRDLLLALKFLSDNVDNKKALAYSKRFIRINDSLYKQERAVRNKFARIRFETDRYISKSEKLSKRILRISILAGGLLLTVILLYIILVQRSRSKLLKEKIKADQEIYHLTWAHKKELEKNREDIQQHLSRELHDAILGRIFGVRLNLETLNEEDDMESKQKRAESIEEIKKIAQEIRAISHQLSKDSLIQTNFNSLLQELIKKQPDTLKLKLTVNPSLDWEKVENAIKINIYRIIQEGIKNIYKHSQATKAGIEIKKTEQSLTLLIHDNGKGFKIDTITSGIGLKNIKKRSRSIGGKFSIQSDSTGTFLKIIISL